MSKFFVHFRSQFSLFILLFLLAVSVYGQGYLSFRSEREQIKRETRFRIGPFRILPTLNFKNIGYDDNVYFQREESKPSSDFTWTVSPEFRIHLLLGRKLILSLIENPEYVHYFEQKRERRLNNTIVPSFKFLFLNRFVLSGDYFWSNRRYRASSEFDVRANEKTNKYNGRLFYETARETSLGFSGSVQTFRYEDITLPGEEISLSRSLNREEKSGYFEFYYRIFKKKGYFFIRGGYSEYKFEHVQSSFRDSFSYQAISGISFPLLGKVRGTFSLGYKKLAPQNKEKLGFSGLVSDTSLSFKLLFFQFHLNYGRDTHFSYWTENVFFSENSYGAGVSFYFSKFLRGDYFFRYGGANYPEPGYLKMPDGSLEELKRKDINRNHTIGLVFRIIKKTGIGIMINFWERDSNFYWANRKRTFIGGYLTHDF